MSYKDYPAVELIHVIAKLSEFDELQTIYARQPWTANSHAMVAQETDSGELPLEAQRLGCSYFLEVIIAREFLEDWNNGPGKTATIESQCDRLIQYAMNDA